MFRSLYSSLMLRTPSNKLVPATTTNWWEEGKDEAEGGKVGVKKVVNEGREGWRLEKEREG